MHGHNVVVVVVVVVVMFTFFYLSAICTLERLLVNILSA